MLHVNGFSPYCRSMSQVVRRSILPIAVVIFLLAGARRTLAQTGPDLLVKSWATDQAVDATADALFEPSAHTDGDSSVQLDFYHGLGRWRLIPDSDASPIL